MSTPVPPPPPPSAAPTTLSAPTTVSLPNPPPAITALTQGTTINATVLAALSKGDLRVDTQFGELVLKTPLNLPQGGDISLTLLGQVRGQAMLKLAALNGRPITGATLQGLSASGPLGTGANAGLAGGMGTAATGQAQGTTATPGQPQVGQAGQAVTLSLGGTARSGISATVVRAAPGPLTGATLTGGSASGSLPAPPQGSQLVVRIAQVTPQGQGGPPPGLAAPPQGAPPPGALPPGIGASPGAGAGSASPAAGSAATAPPTTGDAARGGEGAARAVPGGTPPRVPNSTLQALTGRTIPGTVVSTSSGAQPVVDTGIGQLALRTRLDARPGDMVQLQIVGRPAGGPSLPPPQIQPTPPLAGLQSSGTPLTGGSGWPTLQESLRVLGASEGGQGGANPLLAATPRPGPQLAAAVTTFVGAMRTGGDTAKWPGDPAMRALEKAGGRKGADLARQLGADMRDMASRSTEGGAEWRSYSVPFLNGAEIDPIRVILRRQGGSGDEEEGGGQGRGEQGQRFLVDVELSRLGPLQFDGLYKKKGRQLDLVVRTRDALPQVVRHDIQVLYNTALVTMGLNGRVQFDTQGAFIKPTPAPAGSMGGPPSPFGTGPGGVVV